MLLTGHQITEATQSMAILKSELSVNSHFGKVK